MVKRIRKDCGRRRTQFKLNGMWSLQYNKCVSCGTTSVAHECKGLCIRCYSKQQRNKDVEKYREIVRKSAIKSYYKYQEKNQKKGRDNYWKDPEKHRQDVSKWRKDNPEKAALHKYNGSPNKRPLEYWQNRYFLIFVEKKGCCICGTREHLHIHHIIPESKGGSHKLENLEVYCIDHHLRNGLHRRRID